MNMNRLAQEITLKEGLKESISIAQVKEVLKILAKLLYSRPSVLIKFLQYGEKLNK